MSQEGADALSVENVATAGQLDARMIFKLLCETYVAKLGVYRQALAAFDG